MRTKISDYPIIEILEQFQDGFAVVGFDYRYAYVNNAFAQFAKGTPDSIIGKKITEITNLPETDPAYLAVKQGLEEKIPVLFEYEHIFEDGTEIWVQLNVQPIAQGVFMIARNITEQKKYEKELLKKNVELEAILESIQDGIYVYDNQGSILRCNSAANKMLGYTKEDVEAKMHDRLSALTIITEEGKKLEPDEMPAARAAIYKETCIGKLYGVKKRGDLRWLVISSAPLIANGTHIGGVVSMQDVTEKKQREELLKESELRFRTLADNISQLAWIVDPESGPIWFNKRFEEFTGMSSDELIRFDRSILHHPKYAGKVLTRYHEALAKGESWEDTFPFKNKNGEYRWFIARAIPLFDENKNINRWFGTLTDFTEQKELQENLKKALEEREILLKEIHHRTKNNMQIISSLMSLKSNTFHDDSLKDVFFEMQNRIRAIALVHEKLYRSSNLVEINFSEYILDLINLLLRSFSGHERIEFIHNMDEVCIDIDTAVTCGLVFSEIILNSLKYAFPGNSKGKIEVNLVKLSDEEIEITFKDNGVGFDPDTMQTESIGLVLIRELVQGQLNGSASLNVDNGVNWKLRFKGALSNC